MKNYKETIILFAEDDDGHAELTIQGLRNSGICNEIIRFANGEDLWYFLSGKGDEIFDKNKSHILLLDINMPIMNGVEVLKLMKSDEILKKIPVIMLTTTDNPKEIDHCYALGCNIYITKPIDFIVFAETLKRLGLFIQIVSL